MVRKDRSVIVCSGLLAKMNVFESNASALNCCREKLADNGAVMLSFVNAHAFNIACTDEQFYDSILYSDLIFRDGVGVEILCRLVGTNPGNNLNGTDLIPILLDEVFAGKRVALFGSTDRELQKAKESLVARGVQVVGTLNGFESYSSYLTEIEKKQPELVILGMGMPKQEHLSAIIRQSVQDVSIINGGAIIDFIAGKVSRAPVWVRYFKMEWIYRLSKEPKRLYRRYIIGNAVFLYRAVLLKLYMLRFKSKRPNWF